MENTYSNRAFYDNSIEKFINEKSDFIFEKLNERRKELSPFDEDRKQDLAWKQEIEVLQNKLRDAKAEGWIIFEYTIVRLARRIDVVILVRHMVFSLEFKNGAKVYLADDAEQAEDYAFDLKSFHEASEGLYVCPILIATKAKEAANNVEVFSNKEISLQKANDDTFLGIIQDIASRFGTNEALDYQDWMDSRFHVTPNIMDSAAEAVCEITRDVGDEDEGAKHDVKACLTACKEIILKAQRDHERSIIFVTGVPGAGKTLVGLKLAFDMALQKEVGQIAFLSGNDSLVSVMQASIRDTLKVLHPDIKSGDKNSPANTIQRAYLFRKSIVSEDNTCLQLDKPANATKEKVIVFDEAQRAWNQKQLTAWMGKNAHGLSQTFSIDEPSFFLTTMERQPDWAVIVCLVGLGQDIADGELGIGLWLSSVMEKHPTWNLYYSDAMTKQNADPVTCRNEILAYPKAHEDPRLHLSVSLRSFKSAAVGDFVDAVLSNRPEDAKAIYQTFAGKYPLYITRDLAKAKHWAKKQTRGSQHCGLMATASAQRLQPYGIYTVKDLDVAGWFLSKGNDFRSSNMMEIAASEFKVQGLELDWGVLGWDADLRRKNGDWDYYNFRGGKWTARHQKDSIRYLINAYRVLLTRSRQGMVIFVPEGLNITDTEFEDGTRDRKFYDPIFDYLHEACGINELP